MTALTRVIGVLVSVLALVGAYAWAAGWIPGTLDTEWTPTLGGQASSP